MSGALGAEIVGLDLAQPMDDPTFAAFCDAWHKYQVLFFRDQELTPEQHIALGKRFGEIDRSAFIPTLEGYPDIRLQDMSGAGNIPGDVDWHHDNSFVVVPQKCSFPVCRRGTGSRRRHCVGEYGQGLCKSVKVDAGISSRPDGRA